MPSITSVFSSVRRFLLIHRRGLAVLSLGLAVWLGLSVLRPPPPPTVDLWTASHDLASGTVLAADDFRRTAFLEESTPPAAAEDLASLVGRTLATPLGRGEVAARTQVLGNERLAGYPGRSAVGLRIPDADAGALLHPGDRVDLVASDPQADRAAELLVRNAVVLTVPRPSASAGSASQPGLLVVFAVPSNEVVHIASVGSTLFLTPIWNR